MLKHFSCILLLLAMRFSFAQELSGTQKIPAEVEAGKSFIIETTINRGRLTGFVIFFQPLPQGATVKEIESKGGTFSSSENGARIIWLAPPAETTYTISFQVTVPKDTSGSETLVAQISYLSDGNTRKTYDLEAKTITIVNSAATVKTVPPTVIIAPTKDTNVIIEKTKTIEPATPVKEIANNAITKTVTTSPTTPIEPITTKPTPIVKTYRVQVGAYSLKPKLAGVPELYTIVLDNGITKYFSGNFDSIENAGKRKMEMIEQGFKGAFIVTFENGKIVK